MSHRWDVLPFHNLFSFWERPGVKAGTYKPSASQKRIRYLVRPLLSVHRFFSPFCRFFSASQEFCFSNVVSYFYFLFPTMTDHLPQNILSSLTRALTNHLRDNTGNVQLSLLEQLLLRGSCASRFTSTPNTPSTPIPPHTPSDFRVSSVRTPFGEAVLGTPGAATPETPISRASSLTSISSASSAISAASNNTARSASSCHDWDDDPDEGDFVIKRRKPSDKVKKKDNRVVTNPVLGALDAPHLAPHPEASAQYTLPQKVQKRARA